MSRAGVEDLAAEVYWVTSGDAALVLGVNRARLQQLSEADRVTFMWYRDQVRLDRRAQLEVVGNARRLRFEGAPAA